VPVLGGKSDRVKEDVWQAITFSPDGNRFVFVRESPTDRELTLLLSDGEAESVMAVRKMPDGIGPPSWSPDGKVVAFTDGNADTGLPNKDVVVVGVADGTEQRLTRQKWPWIGAIQWLPDGKRLLFAGKERRDGAGQIWEISYPGGDIRRITNDLGTYSGLSVSADGRALITIESDQLTNIWVAPDGDASRATKLESPVSWYPGISWTAGGKLVYAAKEGIGGYFIGKMDSSGGSDEYLTGGSPLNYLPSVSPDGKQIVFTSDRKGTFNLWLMDLAGDNRRQLTSGPGENYPCWFPDGKWIAYTNIYSNKPTVWKVPVEGGEPIQLTDKRSSRPAVSPDGARIACVYWDGPDTENKVAVISSSGGEALKTLIIPTTANLGAGLRWSPDGRSLIYVDTRDDVSNLWAQPVDGGRPKQLTDFRADGLFFFDWSRDRRQLACVRGLWTARAVLITDF
jgi:Tol biopolymer transport system component